MNMDKKEQIMWLCILVIIVLFVIFMPQIESVLSGRKLKKSDDIVTDSNKTGEINEGRYPSMTSCDLAETLDTKTNSNLSKNVTFKYNTSGTVTEINETKKYRYTVLAQFNKVKNTQAINEIGIRQTVTVDATNMTLIVNDVITVADLQKMIDYPAGYTELKEYLKNNNYVCQETK